MTDKPTLESAMEVLMRYPAIPAAWTEVWVGDRGDIRFFSWPPSNKPFYGEMAVGWVIQKSYYEQHALPTPDFDPATAIWSGTRVEL